MNEDAFFADLFNRLPRTPPSVVVPPGDDCAAIDAGNGQLILLAVDQVVAGRHYSVGSDEPSPEMIGRKLLARNLSDIAAMGGIPTCCLTALASSPRRGAQWLSGLLHGIQDLADQYGIHMIGGDLAGTFHDDVGSLTIVGQVARDQVCTRQGAKANDLLIATGWFGASFETGHHLTFAPRLEEGQWLARTGCITAMMDVSDGLLLDASRLARAAETALRLEISKIPGRVAGLNHANVLGDGEDYELIAAVKPDHIKDVLNDWPFHNLPLTVIGQFKKGCPGVVDEEGRELTQQYTAGYDHLENV